VRRLHRKEAVHSDLEFDDAVDLVAEPVDPNDVLATRSDLRAALDLLAAVPERRRRAKALHVMGYTYDDIGELIGLGHTRANALVTEANMAMRREHLAARSKAPARQDEAGTAMTFTAAVKWPAVPAPMATVVQTMPTL
jgi:DNA-directed RNA polymerase specialized sigma24 family protein